jgi:hypothetical protein
VIAVATVTDCHRSTLTGGGGCCRDRGGLAVYGASPAWHFTLANIRALPDPVPCRGQLQLGWTVPADITRDIHIQLALEEALR